MALNFEKRFHNKQKSKYICVSVTKIFSLGGSTYVRQIIIQLFVSSMDTEATELEGSRNWGSRIRIGREQWMQIKTKRKMNTKRKVKVNLSFKRTKGQIKDENENQRRLGWNISPSPWFNPSSTASSCFSRIKACNVSLCYKYAKFLTSEGIFQEF